MFGWTVAVEKAAVECELWKKLQWAVSCEKSESRLVESAVTLWVELALGYTLEPSNS